MTQFVKVELILTDSEAERLQAERARCEEIHGPTSLDVVASLLVCEALVERLCVRTPLTAGTAGRSGVDLSAS